MASLVITNIIYCRWENRNKTPIYNLLSLGVVGHLIVNMLFTLFLLSISGTNYPGGTAILNFHKLARNETNVSVHVANLAAQTGVTRFTEIHPNWTLVYLILVIFSFVNLVTL